MRAILVFVGLCLAISLGNVILVQFSTDKTVISETVTAQTNDQSQFRLLNGSFMGDHAIYTFQTPPEEKNYADDCLGCKQEVGNATIFAEFGCPKKAQYLFDSNSEIGVEEKTPMMGKDGSVLGEQRLILFKDKEKVYGARLFWIEGNDFWAVQAPTVELTKALKESKEYDLMRKKVAEEIKSYVPIQNANTKIKKTC